MIERLVVELAGHARMLEERDRLGAEEEEPAEVAPVERLDPDPVARQEEAFALRVVDGEGEHAEQLVRRRRRPRAS